MGGGGGGDGYFPGLNLSLERSFRSMLTSVEENKEIEEIEAKQELTLVLLSTAGDRCWRVKD